MKKGKVFIGTSGYSYAHWGNNVFYPEKLAQGKWLEYYCQFFNTVELNVTFYRLPQKTAFKSWRKRAPEDFKFAVKGSRFITHIKKLLNAEEALEHFFEYARELKERLAVVLWQFPPGMKANLARLREFCTLLSKTPVRQVFEFRHPSWFNQDMYEILKRYNFSLCLAHSGRWPLEEVITSNFVYLRFHGGESLYPEPQKATAARLARRESKRVKPWMNVYQKTRRVIPKATGVNPVRNFYF